MEENKEEERLEKASPPESENPSAEIIVPEINQETEIMEVHHHPDLHHKPKKWKEYFLEFLMIFLAVTLGFFAESLRENLLEKERVHRYMEEMVDNLRADTMRFHHLLNYNESTSPLLDSLRYEIDSGAMGHIHANHLYFFASVSGQFSTVLFKESAISELKNSGSMRMIKDRHLSDQILEYYDRWVKATENVNKELTDASSELNRYEQDFLNAQYFEKLIKLETTFSYDPDTSINNYINQIKERYPPLVLLNTNPADLKKLNNKVIATESALHNYNSFVRLDLNLADSLILKIKKEYSLDN
jgi:hypothetical protein